MFTGIFSPGNFLLISSSHFLLSHLSFGAHVWVLVSILLQFSAASYPVWLFLPQQISKKSHSQLNFIFSNLLTKPSLFHIFFISSLPATWKANTWLLFWQSGSNIATLHNVHKKAHTWEKFTHRKIHMMNLQVAPLPLSHLYPILFSPAGYA